MESYSLGKPLSDLRGAKVYRAERLADRHAILLKVLDPEHGGAQDVDRLRHEYEVGRALAGLAVVEPLVLSTFEGRPALEFEGFPGSSLEELIGTPMPIGDFLPLAASLAGAVADIHERGVIHRDLKPGNVLFDPESGNVEVCGFGISARVAHEQGTAARMGFPGRMIEGSLPYMSPEQTGRMNQAIDSRSDLYSLGVTFYQLLTARLPFDAPDALGWIHCHVARKPPRPDEVRPSLPHALSDIILKLLAKMPEDRYQSAAGLLHDLERCRRLWRKSGTIEPFVLGERDVSDRFLIPQKLYGREAECSALRAALERVGDTGTHELVLVSGYSGIGKSAVVHDLLRPIVGRRGFFLSGKFEQYKREIPYLPITQAFRELALDILAESEPHITAWRERLRHALLGPSARLIVDLIPQMALILGAQPPVPPAPLTDAETRQRIAFRELFGAFAAAGHPLTMFLDDLQWTDAASLKLLSDLMSRGGALHLLVIGAYRDNEVDASHPLMRMIHRVRQSGALVRDIALGPLSEADVGQLVADALRCSRAEGAPLARLVCEKTGGNPFFAIQFLTVLYRHGSISFDPDARRWRWDVMRIRAEGYTDNVAELMVGKLRRLPDETREALKMAACIGAKVDGRTLAMVFQRDPEPALRAALEENLLLRVDDAYRFPHDRVQEAAHSLIPEGERSRVHLEIGRRLASRIAPQEVEEKIFDIVNQLDRGAALITSHEERGRVAELNLVAGRRAKASTAYASACTYLAAGMALLDESWWHSRYELIFNLWLERANCEFRNGQFELAERLIAQLFPRCASKTDAAEVYQARIALQLIKSEVSQAVDSALTCLRLFGIDMPAHPTGEDVQAEYTVLRRGLEGRSIEDLIDLPLQTDPEVRAAMEVLNTLRYPGYQTDIQLYYLIVCRMANLSMAHGTTGASTQGYGWLGMLLGPVFHSYGDGARFAKLACDIAEKHGFLAHKPATLLAMHAAAIWTQPITTAIKLSRDAFDVATETGALVDACFSAAFTLQAVVFRGGPLDGVWHEVETAVEFVRKVGYDDLADGFRIQQRFIDNMQGRTSSFSTFNSVQFDEGAFESQLTGIPWVGLSCGYWVTKLKARFLSGDYAEALAAAEKAKECLWAFSGLIHEAEYVYFRALTLAAVQEHAPPDEQRLLRESLPTHRDRLREWAENSPSTFCDKHALVSAEIARIEGRELEAERSYELSIRSARDNGFVHNEAIAYETASRFYRARGFDQIADAYLREGRDRYRRWGAHGKVQQLERLYPQLVEPKPFEGATTLALRPEQVDLLSVVKASQTISGVMVRDELVRTLLRLVLETGNARRARLVLSREGDLEIAAESVVDEASPTMPFGVASAEPAAARVPASILHYVQRTQERVLLGDAVADAGRFSSDPYFASVRPRSVLCLPIRRQAEVVALLYLENDLVPGAFTRERLEALELLAAQAAVSLENAHLLEREHAGRVAAEAAGQRALLLGEATALMSTTLDYEGVFNALTRLCARALADWVVIDLYVEGQIVRLAGAHRDPGKEPLLRELADAYPARIGTATPVVRVLQSGLPLCLPAPTDDPSLPDDVVRRFCVDERHAELVRRLGCGSTVIVPLVARGQRLGALTLVSTLPHRFAPADVELAEELGRRAALAIDNARLLEETRRALRLREEFIAVASHELGTPLTSLRLAVQHLLRTASVKGTVSAEALGLNLSRVLSKTDRLQQLTSQILDAMRIEEGGLELRRTEVNLERLVRDAVKRFEGELASAHCAVSIECAASVVGLWDASRLGQVVTNLLTNAMKFGSGRPIEIRVQDADGLARLTVTDHGIGIDPARRRRVFERFERAVSAAHYGGLGLGLYVARWIVLAHGGTIDVDSEPGLGSTFTVMLPRGETGSRTRS